MGHEKYLQLINTNHYPSDDDEIVADDRATPAQANKLVDVVLVMMTGSGLQSAQRKRLQSVQSDCHALTGWLASQDLGTNILHIWGFQNRFYSAI
jgi:hypothetical protein